MEENTYTPGDQGHTGAPQNLPNSTIVLVLGILSIVLCFCYGIVGVILGGIALYLAGKDKALYTANPEMYTESSYKNLKAGRICAIIGLVLSGIYMIFSIVILTMFPEFMEQYMEMLEAAQ